MLKCFMLSLFESDVSLRETRTITGALISTNKTTSPGTFAIAKAWGTNKHNKHVSLRETNRTM